MLVFVSFFRNCDQLGIAVRIDAVGKRKQVGERMLWCWVLPGVTAVFLFPNESCNT